MKLPSNVRGLAIPWFTMETWPRLREISVDRDGLFDTFDEWHASAEAWFDRNVADGQPIKRVYVDPDELLAWCKANGFPVDGHARAGFAAYVLMRKERAH